MNNEKIVKNLKVGDKLFLKEGNGVVIAVKCTDIQKMSGSTSLVGIKTDYENGNFIVANKDNSVLLVNPYQAKDTRLYLDKSELLNDIRKEYIQVKTLLETLEDSGKKLKNNMI